MPDSNCSDRFIHSSHVRRLMLFFFCVFQWDALAWVSLELAYGGALLHGGAFTDRIVTVWSQILVELCPLQGPHVWVREKHRVLHLVFFKPMSITAPGFCVSPLTQRRFPSSSHMFPIITWICQSRDKMWSSTGNYISFSENLTLLSLMKIFKKVKLPGWVQI